MSQIKMTSSHKSTTQAYAFGLIISGIDFKHPLSTLEMIYKF